MSEKVTILIVDDDADTRISLRDFFEAKNFEILEAANSEESLELAERHLPDAIVLDIGLPNGEDGKEVCKRLRANPQTAQLPILMLTCHSLVEERTAGLRAGADDYVIKPCDNDEILARIEALFRRIPPKTNFFQRLEHAHSSIEAAEAYRQYVVVLNIDVRASSNIPKSTREEYFRALVFRDYHELVEAIVLKQGGAPMAWAGDGGTSEFVDASSAITASKLILQKFKDHARLSKLELRIGVAAGMELLEPGSIIGKRTSQTHNRAGHLQKYSDINTITIDEEAFTTLRDNSEFHQRAAIDNVVAYEMRLM
jgi:DNA-binding response OmpR family regulator